ncbi:hypothetical protein HBH56_020320 [Parastagonospora nodorum]|nr:hypothetical protein HBH56_020320 [Parastagonospora nodorum]KAH3944210.1 hypothetical protein HBH53_162630 [Parastagonospora nodorum]KAH3967643.1 hypothetical protein HBH51_137850 [Parastagonospora nodorum]KAH4006993.1 hypothetical protein HBI10_014050 [Parastagonospora nodorum]KAH4025637.1 hypothetical protein HBI13_067970 [Parastagonospora nodorum]
MNSVAVDRHGTMYQHRMGTTIHKTSRTARNASTKYQNIVLRPIVVRISSRGSNGVWCRPHKSRLTRQSRPIGIAPTFSRFHRDPRRSAVLVLPWS